MFRFSYIWGNVVIYLRALIPEECNIIGNGKVG